MKNCHAENSAVFQQPANGFEMVCTADSYHPAIFTAKDDDSVGEIILGSTGNPSGNYAACALSMSGGGNFNNMRFAYCQRAIANYDENSISVRDCQFLHCDNPIYFGEPDIGADLTVFNVLAYDFNNFIASEGSLSINIQHLTAHSGTFVLSTDYAPSGESYFNIANSLIVSVSDYFGASTAVYLGTEAATEFLSSDSGVFETGAEDHITLQQTVHSVTWEQQISIHNY